MSRLTLQEKLETVAASHGMTVYYQPPDNIKLNYPCILYFDDAPQVMQANNKIYVLHMGYEITIITKDPDDKTELEIIDAVNYGSLKRKFITDNLYHKVVGCYELY